MHPTIRTIVLAAGFGTLVATSGCVNTPAPKTDKPEKTDCSTELLSGRYLASGSLIDAPASQDSSSAYMQGYFIFDAAGQVEVVRGLSSSNGNNIGWEGKGNYSINADCSGEMSLSAKVGGGIDIKMNFNLLVRKAGTSTVIESIFVVHPGKTSGRLTLHQASR